MFFTFFYYNITFFYKSGILNEICEKTKLMKYTTYEYMIKFEKKNLLEIEVDFFKL